MRKFLPKKAKLIPSEAKCVFQGKIFDVFQWPQKMYDGSTETFEMLRRADTVKIIAVKDGELVITKQEQPHKDSFYDYPGGRVDETDEDELAAAKRELKEETGMEFANWRLIEVRQPFNKIEWLIYTFLATDFIKQDAQDLDAGEKIEVIEMSFDEANEMVDRPEKGYLKRDFGSLEELLARPELFEY